MPKDLTQVIAEATSATKETLIAEYTPTFINKVCTHLGLSPTDDLMAGIGRLAHTNITVAMMIDAIKTPTDGAPTPEILEGMFVKTVADAYRATMPTSAGAKASVISGATAASTETAPPSAADAAHSGAGVGPIAAPAPAVVTSSVVSPISAVVPPAEPPASVVMGYAPPILAPTATRTTTSTTAVGCTWTDCCLCCACCLDTQQQVAVGYTQGVFAQQALSGGSIERDVAIGALAGGRPGIVGAVGNHYAQQVFWRDVCHCCGAPTGCCSCPAPAWECAPPPTIACPTALTCDGNPCQPVVEVVSGCLGTVAGLGTNCFGFFGNALGAVAGALGGCAEGVAAAAGCVTQAVAGCGDAAGACGGCLECCGAILAVMR